VYGPSEDYEKNCFLDELLSIKMIVPAPWLVLDNFNLIYEVRDKNNMNLNLQLMSRSRHTLDNCELFEFAL
jgi:hypothetical protein